MAPQAAGSVPRQPLLPVFCSSSLGPVGTAGLEEAGAGPWACRAAWQPGGQPCHSPRLSRVAAMHGAGPVRGAHAVSRALASPQR